MTEDHHLINCHAYVVVLSNTAVYEEKLVL